jgi:hypothetical protein
VRVYAAAAILAIFSLSISPVTSTAAPATGIWLDQPISNWNIPGGPIPKAPPGGSGNLAMCRSSLRKPAGKEDRAVVAAGWSLTGPPRTAFETSEILGEADADGMCRPVKYQIFLFVRGQFAGTISPVPMDSREDGTAGPTNRSSASEFSVGFERYAPSDAKCCPSKRTEVFYQIRTVQGQPLVVPLRATTTANSPN